MKKQFENFLINSGYKQFTKSGRKSTVYSYVNEIEKVLLWENITWTELAENISNVCKLYDKGGIKEKEGSLSNNTVINALKCFERFVTKI